jgi:hypothetical protein
MRLSRYSDATLLRKSGPEFKQVVSYRGTGTVYHATPSSASIGDYLVICGINGLSSVPLSEDGWASIYSTSSTGSTYFDNSRIHIKICTASDIGSGVSLNASNFYFASNYYVFSNPNNSFSDSNPINSYGKLINFLYNSKNYKNGASTSTVSSINIPNHPDIYGPNYLKIMAMGCNPNSSNADVSYSGPGVFRGVEDGYWWRSLGSVYQYPATQTNGTVFANGGAGGMSWIYAYLI